MKRHLGLVPISHEHRQILFVAQVLKHGVPRFREAPATTSAKLVYAREQRDVLLLPHQQREEALLFPCALAAGLTEVAETLLAEHRAITARLAALDGLDPDGAETAAQLDALGYVLEAHVRAEERGLFPQLQAILPDETLVDLGASWSETGGLSCSTEV